MKHFIVQSWQRTIVGILLAVIARQHQQFMHWPWWASIAELIVLCFFWALFFRTVRST